MESLQPIILAVLGLGFVGDIILHFVIPSRKRKDNAEADRAENDADKAEVERLHMQIEHQQQTLNIYLDLEEKNAARIAALNKSINEKTDQIRNLTSQIMNSEHGRNRDKEEITRLTKEIGDLRVEVEYHKMWRCEWPDCKDPRGRRPPNEKLKGLKYEPPTSKSKA